MAHVGEKLTFGLAGFFCFSLRFHLICDVKAIFDNLNQLAGIIKDGKSVHFNSEGIAVFVKMNVLDGLSFSGLPDLINDAFVFGAVAWGFPMV